MSKSQKVGMTDDTWKFQAILTTLGQETHQKTCSRKHQPTEQSGLNQSATNEEVFFTYSKVGAVLDQTNHQYAEMCLGEIGSPSDSDACACQSAVHVLDHITICAAV